MERAPGELRPQHGKSRKFAQPRVWSRVAFVAVARPSLLLFCRYVTRERLEAMLDYEYLQCNLTLRKERGNDTAFFAFADTVSCLGMKFTLVR